MASDIYALQLYFAVAQQPAMIVWHFRNKETEVASSPDNDCRAIITSMVSTIEPALLGCIPESVTLNGYKCRRVNNSGGMTVSLPRSQAGTRTGTFSSSAIGPCLIWGYQKAGGGWAAGRTFLPGCSEADIDHNVFIAGLRTNITALIVALLQSPALPTSGAPGYDFVIYSPTHNAASGVETGTLSGKPGVQNKRMRPTF